MSLEDEFSRYSNKQAYDAVFTSRMMLRDTEQPDRMIGNTQRADFLPVLHAVLDSLPARPHLFDVGAGAGDIVDLALSRLDAATVHVEEPNEALLERYQQRLALYPALERGYVFAEPLERVLASWSGSRPPFVVDGVLAIHMLCRDFLHKHGRDVDFGVESRDVVQNGWFRSRQPQIVTTIRRRL